MPAVRNKMSTATEIQALKQRVAELEAQVAAQQKFNESVWLCYSKDDVLDALPLDEVKDVDGFKQLMWENLQLNGADSGLGKGAILEFIQSEIQVWVETYLEDHPEHKKTEEDEEESD